MTVTSRFVGGSFVHQSSDVVKSKFLRVIRFCMDMYPASSEVGIAGCTNCCEKMTYVSTMTKSELSARCYNPEIPNQQRERCDARCKRYLQISEGNFDWSFCIVTGQRESGMNKKHKEVILGQKVSNLEMERVDSDTDATIQ